MSDQGDWRGLSGWEQECSDFVDESESSIEGQITAERDAVAQRLFLLFQTSATSVAQLYKGRCPPSYIELWWWWCCCEWWWWCVVLILRTETGH